MSRKPRLLILNTTCLDIVEEHRSSIESRGIEFVANQSFRQIKPEDVVPLLADADAVIPSASVPLLPEYMEGSPGLVIISIAASGYEWLDIEAATKNGIIVTNAPAREGTEVVADMTLGLLLAVAREIPYHDHLVRNGCHQRGIGTMVWGKTLGIVGLGNIGKAVVRRARGFDMKLLATEPYPDRDFVKANKIELVPLEELLHRSDIVSLHLRLNAQTEGMIGSEELEMMKPSAYLINTARVKLVDEHALTSALLNKRIAGAAVDYPPQSAGRLPADKECPLLELPNFVCTPHLGNRAIEGMHAVFNCAVDNAIDVIQGRRPAFVLNPEVYEGKFRASQLEKG